MDTGKVGALIFALRKEKRITQKELAQALHISDKAVSKWETGQGCPDISLLPALGAVFGVKIEQLLQGDLDPNEKNGGNMKRIQFYVCPTCGNIFTSTVVGEISCCGRTIAPLKAAAVDASHILTVAEMDDEYYVTLPHEMKKEHFISFVAYAACDRVLLVKLYPEQDAALRMPKMRGGTFYAYCSQHGLWRMEKKR